MAGKKGMSKGNMGGKRAGSGAPYKFKAKKGDVFIMERSSLSVEHDEVREVAHFLGVSDGGATIEFQIGNDIITIRRPDLGELSLE